MGARGRAWRWRASVRWPCCQRSRRAQSQPAGATPLPRLPSPYQRPLGCGAQPPPKQLEPPPQGQTAPTHIQPPVRRPMPPAWLQPVLPQRKTAPPRHQVGAPPPRSAPPPPPRGAPPLPRGGYPHREQPPLPAAPRMSAPPVWAPSTRTGEARAGCPTALWWEPYWRDCSCCSASRGRSCAGWRSNRAGRARWPTRWKRPASGHPPPGRSCWIGPAWAAEPNPSKIGESGGPSGASATRLVWRLQA
jgi:hypothetical protein